LLIALTVCWVSALAFGFGSLWRYQSTPGEPGEPPSRWPVESTLPRSTDGPTVLQFVHPRCPCSRASLAELEGVIERLPEAPALLVVFMRPPGAAEGWERASTWNRASRIRGATVVTDVDGKESELFGAMTSGQTFAYGADGGLLWSGGLTASRGEVGRSAGTEDIARVLESQMPEGRASPVFGCAIHGDEQRGTR
jgi:hypothetical protein